jgi:hypothetical protein
MAPASASEPSRSREEASAEPSRGHDADSSAGPLAGIRVQ